MPQISTRKMQVVALKGTAAEATPPLAEGGPNRACGSAEELSLLQSCLRRAISKLKAAEEANFVLAEKVKLLEDKLEKEKTTQAQPKIKAGLTKVLREDGIDKAAPTARISEVSGAIQAASRVDNAIGGQVTAPSTLCPTLLMVEELQEQNKDLEASASQMKAQMKFQGQQLEMSQALSNEYKHEAQRTCRLLRGLEKSYKELQIVSEASAQAQKPKVCKDAEWGTEVQSCAECETRRSTPAESDRVCKDERLCEDHVSVPIQEAAAKSEGQPLEERQMPQSRLYLFGPSLILVAVPLAIVCGLSYLVSFM